MNHSDPTHALMSLTAPVAIGGVGGSGTRVVAELLGDLGYFMGGDLNEASDNLWFTLLFKYREVLSLDSTEFAKLYGMFRDRMSRGDACDLSPDQISRLLQWERAGQHDKPWLMQRCASMALPSEHGTPGLWGWKEPNTHMLLDRLADLEPGMRFIHVVRNGLDMALSSNQNQLRLWGPHALADRYEDSERGSLAFWCWAHQRVFAAAEKLGARFHLLRFDELCNNTDEELQRLLQFLQMEVSDTVLQRLGARVGRPSSLQRHKGIPLDMFDPDDVAYVREMGFKIE